MRLYTSQEQTWIIELSENKKNNNLGDLLLSKLLHKNLQSFALRWEITPLKTIYIYVEKSKLTNQNKINEEYFKICDYLYFIEELEQQGLVKLQTVSTEESSTTDNALYDRTKYTFGIPDVLKESFKYNAFFRKDNKNECLYAVDTINQQTYTDVVDLLHKYRNKIIYPLPQLIDIATNQCKTLEQRHFERQDKLNRFSLLTAIAAIIASAICPFIVNKCSSPTEFDNQQFEILEKAIKEGHVVFPDVPDTILIKLTPVKKSPKSKSFDYLKLIK